MKLIDDIESYTDDELDREWSRLEKLTLSGYVEQKMDEIRTEIDRRAA